MRPGDFCQLDSAAHPRPALVPSLAGLPHPLLACPTTLLHYAAAASTYLAFSSSCHPNTLVLPADTSTLCPSLSLHPPTTSANPPPSTSQKIIPTRRSLLHHHYLLLSLHCLCCRQITCCHRYSAPPLHCSILRLAPQCSCSRLVLVAVSTALHHKAGPRLLYSKPEALPVHLRALQHGLGSLLFIANHQYALGHARPSPLPPDPGPEQPEPHPRHS